MKMIAIIDYGIGNLCSIKNMLKNIGVEDVIFAKSEEEIINADKYILPGVGAFDTGMKMLNESGMRKQLDIQVIEKKKPILGICLGMQMLGRRSEEGSSLGLGYIPFDCKKFELQKDNLRVPHMGWDYVDIVKKIPIVSCPKDELRFYFVHSYYAVCDNNDDVLMTCDYGISFAAAVQKDNIYGMQFHPEKSHGFGKWILKNYIEEV